ncbi:MAG: NUDIX domain-containing protein [Rhodospirillales bacterium]|nr:NUDIX domain-containing protein [Rhodospirillales bacterium]MDE2576936.1 NUDIX domain-containing protein [Rhodospirillales bacterium]
MSRLLAHIAACHNAALPGGRTAFAIGAEQVGWLAPGLAAALDGQPAIRRSGDALCLTRAEALPGLARAAAALGFGRHRGESFDVRARPGGAVLAQIDRGALPAFGIAAEGVHLNGLVRRPPGPGGGLHVWIARRAATKALDPGKLDHMVAGGTPAGLSAWQTLLKEAAEEAAIPPGLAARAVKTAEITYAMARPEGLRRDVLHCYDLDLPEEFTPHAADGEVESFALWPVARVLDAVRETDDFKFNVNLVLIDLFLREGLIAGAEAAALRRALAGET